jgi:hypothetical protein
LIIDYLDDLCSDRGSDRDPVEDLLVDAVATHWGKALTRCLGTGFTLALCAALRSPPKPG